MDESLSKLVGSAKTAYEMMETARSDKEQTVEKMEEEVKTKGKPYYAILEKVRAALVDSGYATDEKPYPIMYKKVMGKHPVAYILQFGPKGVVILCDLATRQQLFQPIGLIRDGELVTEITETVETVSLEERLPLIALMVIDAPEERILAILKEAIDESVKSVKTPGPEIIQ